jgi:hypothetical protein
VEGKTSPAPVLRVGAEVVLTVGMSRRHSEHETLKDLNEAKERTEKEEG